MYINDIEVALERLQRYLPMTPLLFSPLLQREFNKNVWLKLETQQPTGSFKPRPAFNSILTHLQKARAHGVIASSSGNFAQGVAYAARELGISALIVMSKASSPYKIERTKALGAEVVLCENSTQARDQMTSQLQQQSGRLLVHPYDSNETIAGDGTIGLELAKQLGDELNHFTVLVPISGGGLISGIAFTLKTLFPKVKIIGIQPKANEAVIQSLKAGHCIDVGFVQSSADALTCSKPGELAFSLIQKYVDDVILIDETAIQTATRFMLEQHKLVAEPAGAISIAAIQSGQISAANCVCIISGGNVDLWKEHSH